MGKLESKSVESGILVCSILDFSLLKGMYCLQDFVDVNLSISPCCVHLFIIDSRLQTAKRFSKSPYYK